MASKSPFYRIIAEPSGAKTLLRKGSAYDNQARFTEDLARGMMEKGVSTRAGRIAAGRVIKRNVTSEAKSGWRWKPY